MRLLIAIAIVITLGLSTTAHAAGKTSTLIAGPLNPGVASNSLICNVVNVSTKDVSLTIEVLDSSGAIVNFFSPPSLAPGEGTVNAASSTILAGFGWCRFTVQGKASAVRATATIRESGRGTIAAVAAF